MAPARSPWLDREVAPTQRVSWPIVVPVLLLLSAWYTYATAFGFSPDAWAARTIQAYLATGELPAGASPDLAAFFERWFVPLVVVGVAFRFGVIFLGPLLYERTLGKPLPMRLATTMILLNFFGFFVAGLVLAAIGLVGMAFGLPYTAGAESMQAAVVAVSGFIERNVPTLVTVPYPWPLVLAAIPGGLGYYAWHRLQHTWRPLWLLTHRTHHAPTHLTQITTTAADDPLGLFLAPVIQGLLIGTATKLFAMEPMVLESLMYTIVSWTIPEIFNHNEPTYSWTIRGPIRRFFFGFMGAGAYHLVHHSSAEEHRVANIGGGPFLIWDRLFGTYFEPPVEKPAMGLTGRPRLWLNPVRMAFAGYLEIATDLRNNRSWKDRLRILLGPVGYSPPNASSYLTRPAAAG